MAKRFNYRKYYGIDFGPEYHIHHMDFDKSNNDISNLLLLPGKLHSRYHFLINGFEGNKGIVSLNFEIIPNGYGIHQYPFTMMEHLCETMKSINYWVNLKATMDHSKYYEDQGVI